jgi:hypothetical protein
MTQDTAERVVSKYLSAWNETDATRRRVALAALFTEDCRYVDPLAAVAGVTALDELVASVQKQLPGFEFRLLGKVDAHHEQARFTWQAAPAGATEAVVVGFDVMLLDGGRIQSVFGFLDQVPT